MFRADWLTGASEVVDWGVGRRACWPYVSHFLLVCMGKGKGRTPTRAATSEELLRIFGFRSGLKHLGSEGSLLCV